MDLFLKLVLTLLIFFTPFSFAATEPWAFSVVQGLVLLGTTAVLFSRRTLLFPSLFKSVFGAFLIVIILGLVQSCFAQTLLTETIPAYPITLMRLYTLEHVSLFVTYAAVVLLTFQVYQSFDEVKQLVWTLVLAAACVELCKLLFPNGEYITFLTGLKAGSSSVGPFLNRNHAGVFFVMSALLALGLFFTHQLHYKKLFTRAQKNAFVVQQVCLGLLSLGLMLAAVYTRSRGAMLSLFVGLFGYAFLCIWCVPSQIRRRLKRIFYTLLLLVVSSAWVYTHVEDINEFAQRQNGASAEIRAMMYRSAVRILDQYPVWGIGIGAMPVVINQYTEFDVHQYIERLHNDWLEITLEIGYAGAAMLLIALGWFIAGALRRLKQLDIRKQFLFAALLSALLALCTGSTVDFHFFIPGCALMFFIILGLVQAPTFHHGHIHSWHCGWLGALLLVCLLGAACYVPLQKTRCWRAYVFGHGLKMQAKLASYEQGLSYYPSPRYAVRLGNSYYNMARRSTDPVVQLFYLEQAQDIAKEYLEHYPKDKELSRLYMRARHRLTSW
ncbi:MAG: O-antigen ligase family protein [Elusimicrobiaceae bacterium]|nr:O-antigen ligase family protein [Elusimicrobiaceae bacterium]